jgi:hypothetical protein
MAFSYGFFNAKNLDRVYTAEHFTSYLSSIICDGIQDTYGECFSITPTGGFQIRIGSGKAWIQGHYFQNDNGYILDLSQYADSSLPRYVTVGISCDTQESVRSVQIEVLAGTPAVAPFIPSFSNNDTKTTLTLCQVRVNGGSSGITASNITDCRDDEELCGYCRCILGKCRVTEMLSEMAKTNATLGELQKRLDAMNSQISELQTKVDDLTAGEILATGQCGENIYYVLYDNGKLLLRGTGATYDYTSHDSVFYQNDQIKEIVLSNGITSLGDRLFYHCANAKTVSLPATLTSIGDSAFAQEDAVINDTAGLTSVTIPQAVTAIQSYAFYHTAIAEVTVPASVKTWGKYAFSGCAKLKTARVACDSIGAFAFTRCTALSSLTISANCRTFGENMLTYCESLKAITYEGTKEQWNAITKPTNWMASDAKNNYHNGYLQRINCVDGAFVWDSENNVWKEETA